jgi:acetylornithine deacetylase/succinyl-diaminopimelate desuccinylase-like protein
LDFIKASEKTISIDSSPSIGTRDLVESFEAFALSMGLLVEKKHYSLEGVEQALIFVRPKHRAPKELVFLSPIETVEPGSYSFWSETGNNPFKATIKGDAIFGLGSATGKLDFLCKLQALEEVAEKKFYQISPVVVGVFGSEPNFTGSRRLLNECNLQMEAVIVGEPTSLMIANSYSGQAIVRVEIPFSEQEIKNREHHEAEESTSTQSKIFRGSSCHASTPQFGKSALKELVAYLRKLPEHITIINMDAGLSPEMVPAEALLEVDVDSRYDDQVAAKIKQALDVLDRIFEQRFSRYVKRIQLEDFPGYNIGFVRTTRTSIELEGCFFLTEGITKERVKDWLNSVPSDVLRLELLEYKAASRLAEDHPLVEQIRKVLQELQLPTDLLLKYKTNDASYFQLKGVPAIAVGPGDPQGSSHLPNEKNSLSQLEHAMKMYSLLLQRMCV